MSRTSRIATIAVVGASLSLTSIAVEAASVLRKGQKAAVTGEIQKITKTEITIKPKTRDAETIPVNEVVRVRFDGEPAYLNPARSAEEKGQLQFALENYLKALSDVDATNTMLKGDTEYLIARTTARMALADPAKRDEAIKKLEEFRKTNSESFRFFEALDFLAQVQLAKGDFDNAKTSFTEMEKAPWGDYKMAARIGNARVLMKQGQFGPALDAFNQVAAMPGNGPAEVSRRQEALLGKATCLQQQQQFEEAIKVLDGVIESVPPEDTRVQAEAYVRQGDCLQQMGKQKEALLAYLHVDVLFSQETAAHAEALYQLSKLWNVDGQPGRAAEAAAKLQNDYPNSEWAKKVGGTAE